MFLYSVIKSSSIAGLIAVVQLGIAYNSKDSKPPDENSPIAKEAMECSEEMMSEIAGIVPLIDLDSVAQFVRGGIEILFDIGRTYENVTANPNVDANGIKWNVADDDSDLINLDDLSDDLKNMLNEILGDFE